MASLTSDKLCDVACVHYCTSSLRCCALGTCIEGGNLVYKQGGVAWIVAPASSEVSRTWYCRADAVTTAQSAFACGNWFIPNVSELKIVANCYVHVNGMKLRAYWTNNVCVGPFSTNGWTVSAFVSYDNINCTNGSTSNCNRGRPSNVCVRAIRKVYY